MISLIGGSAAGAATLDVAFPTDDDGSVVSEDSGLIPAELADAGAVVLSARSIGSETVVLAPEDTSLLMLTEVALGVLVSCVDSTAGSTVSSAMLAVDAGGEEEADAPWSRLVVPDLSEGTAELDCASAVTDVVSTAVPATFGAISEGKMVGVTIPTGTSSIAEASSRALIRNSSSSLALRSDSRQASICVYP